MTDTQQSEVERVARAMLPILGYVDVADWNKVWVGNQFDSVETGSLAYLCRSLAEAALATLRPSEAEVREVMLDLDVMARNLARKDPAHEAVKAMHRAADLLARLNPTDSPNGEK